MSKTRALNAFQLEVADDEISPGTMKKAYRSECQYETRRAGHDYHDMSCPRLEHAPEQGCVSIERSDHVGRYLATSMLARAGRRSCVGARRGVNTDPPYYEGPNLWGDVASVSRVDNISPTARHPSSRSHDGSFFGDGRLSWRRPAER